jgi:hypothetical protein
MVYISSENKSTPPENGSTNESIQNNNQNAETLKSQKQIEKFEQEMTISKNNTSLEWLKETKKAIEEIEDNSLIKEKKLSLIKQISEKIKALTLQKELKSSEPQKNTQPPKDNQGETSQSKQQSPDETNRKSNPSTTKIPQRPVPPQVQIELPQRPVPPQVQIELNELSDQERRYNQLMTVAMNQYMNKLEQIESSYAKDMEYEKEIQKQTEEIMKTATPARKKEEEKIYANKVNLIKNNHKKNLEELKKAHKETISKYRALKSTINDSILDIVSGNSPKSKIVVLGSLAFKIVVMILLIILVIVLFWKVLLPRINTKLSEYYNQQNNNINQTSIDNMKTELSFIKDTMNNMDGKFLASQADMKNEILLLSSAVKNQGSEIITPTLNKIILLLEKITQSKEENQIKEMEKKGDIL